MKRKIIAGLTLLVIISLIFIIASSPLYYLKLDHNTPLPFQSSLRLYSNESGREKLHSPATRIVFLKTAKTGSSTISSIIGRYAYTRNLTMPRAKSTGNKVPFTRQMMEGQPNLNILATHTLYNRPEMDAVFGDALYVTILREPAAQFESCFGYYHMERKLNLEKAENPIEEFMHNPEKYMDVLGPKESRKTLNHQFRLLGLPSSKFGDEWFIRHKLKQVEFEFDLVMINEYFDESLILLKNLFSWQFDDILYLSKKIRTNRTELSKTLKDKIRSRNSADVMLYDHFNRTFWRKISESGNSFFDDLDIFRKKRIAATEKCVNEYSYELNLRRVNLPDSLSEREHEFCLNLDRSVYKFQELMDSEKSLKLHD